MMEDFDFLRWDLCRVVFSCDNWYELMVGKLLFTNPLVTNSDYELSCCADWSKKVWHDDTPSADMDKLLDAAFRHDFMEIITLSR